ncbi:unnamed protein product, partial [marine sediment metagenome]
LVLPSGPDQSREDLEYVVETLKEINFNISSKFRPDISVISNK